MCQLLAEFLRESLDVGASPSIALGREVALAEQYLRIERVRFGSRLSVTTSIAPGAAEAQVPPLLLQPLVENAVRHGIATRIEGGAIEVAVLRSGEHVLIDVHNPRDSDGARPGTGRGLELVRRRLAATFGPRAHLVVSSTEDAFHVRLSIPATAGPAADAVRALAATLPEEAPAASRSRDADRSGRRAESRPAASEAEAR